MGISGNGQHRRPRQVPRIVVTFGVAGAGIAIPLLTSGAAHAATAPTWDRVAGCETGGQWSADRDDGLYGGLDLTQNVWERYGGTAYADSPDLASRQEQIAVAQRLLDARGPGYWTGCAVTAGLARGGPAPDVDPGTGPSDAGPTDPGLLGGLLTAATAAPTTPVAAPTPPAVPTASPTAPASAPASASASPPPSASAPPSAASASSSPSRDASSAPAPAPASGGRHAKPAPRPAGAESYTVRPGDNLDEIATERALPGGWPALYAANRRTVGGDPDLIRPGQRLTLG